MDSHITHHPPGDATRQLAWLASGCLVAALGWALLLAADETFFSQPMTSRLQLPILILIASGSLYLVSVVLAPQTIGRKGLVVAVILAGVLRIPMWLAPAIPGADYNRYLWDGAVTAAGINPYRHSPVEALEGTSGEEAVERLRQEGAHVLEAIEPTNAHLRTCYPPVAQGLFALAYRIAPFRPLGWRIVLLGADVLAAIAILGMLRATGRPLSWWAVYLWNPLLAFETYLRCHVDLAVGAAVILFLWALTRRKLLAAAVALVAAVGLKLYPVLLAPLLIRRAWPSRRKLLLTAAVLLGLGGSVLALFLPALQNADSGTLAYARTWEGNAGAFRLILRVARWATDRGPWPAHRFESPQSLARWLALAMLAGFGLWQGCRPPRSDQDLSVRVATVLLAVLLLSPTLWPWYFLPLIPLAALRPTPAVLIWSALLPLAYLPQAWLPGPWRAWAIHLPVWAALAGQRAIQRPRGKREARTDV